MNKEYYQAPTTESLPVNFYTGSTARLTPGQAVEHQFTGTGYYAIVNAL